MLGEGHAHRTRGTQGQPRCRASRSLLWSHLLRAGGAGLVARSILTGRGPCFLEALQAWGSHCAALQKEGSYQAEQDPAVHTQVAVFQDQPRAAIYSAGAKGSALVSGNLW